MASAAMLFKQNPDGTVSGVYLNFDGYPDGAGVLLRKHHNTEAAVDALLALGDLRGLEDDGSIEAYHRDRGERVKPAREIASVDDAMTSCSGIDYFYLWTAESGWRCIGKWGRRQDLPIPAEVHDETL